MHVPTRQTRPGPALILCLALTLGIAASAPPAGAAPGDENWSSLFSPSADLDGAIYAMVLYGGDLIVGGNFDHAGNAPLDRVARWDGGGWRPLGAGLPGVYPSALAVYRDTLYAENWRWDGAIWSEAFAIDGSISCLAVYVDRLIAGGSFTFADGAPARNLLAWDGEAAVEFAGGCDDDVLALCVDGGALCAGGVFTEAGGVPAARVARWDGAAWHEMAGGLDGGSFNYGLYDLLHVGGRLYAAGRFDSAGGTGAHNVAVLDGGVWRALGSGVAETPTTLAWRDGALYLGGDLEESGGLTVGGLARWDGEPVPVLASGFRGRRDGAVVDLSWETAVAAGAGEFRIWRDDPDGAPRRLPAAPACNGPLCACRDDTAPTAALRYRLQWRREDGSADWVAETRVDAAAIPSAVCFLGAHPNPFNPRVEAAFTVGAPQRVRIAVLDLAGRELVRLADRPYGAGRHDVSWNGRTADGRALPAGVYLLNLDGEGGRDCVKISLLR